MEDRKSIYMNKTNQMSLKNENWLSINEAAKHLRISKDTLRRWEKEKIIKAYRSPTNRRYYRQEDLELVFNQRPELEEKPISAPTTASGQPSPRKPPKLNHDLSFLNLYRLNDLSRLATSPEPMRLKPHSFVLELNVIGLILYLKSVNT